jgi:hypothetical protein
MVSKLQSKVRASCPRAGNSAHGHLCTYTQRGCFPRRPGWYTAHPTSTDTNFLNTECLYLIFFFGRRLLECPHFRFRQLCARAGSRA